MRFAQWLGAGDAVVPFVLGHRGSGKSPVSTRTENTLASFRAAAALREPHALAAVECDVWLTSDAHVVVFHDETLARLTGGADARRVSDCTLAELRGVPLVNAHASPCTDESDADRRIPLLSELLDLVIDASPTLRLFVELKGASAADALARAVLRVVQAHRAAHELLQRRLNFISMQPAALAAMRDALRGAGSADTADVQCGLIVSERIDDEAAVHAHVGALALSNVGVRWDVAVAHPDALRVLRERYACDVWMWNPRGAEQIAAALGAGACGVGSDVPAESLVHVGRWRDAQRARTA